MTKYIEYRLGYSFLYVFRLMAIAFAIIGILVLISSPVFAAILLTLAIFVFFSSENIIFNPQEKKYKQYTMVFGLFPKGEWKSYKAYTDIAILKTKTKLEFASMGNRSISENSIIYTVYILQPNHRMKILVYRNKDFEKAKAFTENMNEKLELRFTQYNPEISEQTKARRRR
jgi:hypothetical protein